MLRVYNVIRDVLKATYPEATYVYDSARDNTPTPYYRIKMISSDAEYHKDTDAQGPNYINKKPYHQRYRIQIDFVNPDKASAYSDTAMGDVSQGIKDLHVAPYYYDISTISHFTRSFVKEGVYLYAQTLDIYLDEYIY